MTTVGSFGFGGVAGGGGGGGSEHYIGESFDGGIIYHLYKGSDGSEHGLIVSLTESPTTIMWQSVLSFCGGISSYNGLSNTSLMINSPTKDYINTLGLGWYLPSIDELGLLIHNRFGVQKGLTDGGYTLLSMTQNYWSSTEISALAYTQARNVSFNSSAFSVQPKGQLSTARGIRAF